jgi:hypothetical protein
MQLKVNGVTKETIYRQELLQDNDGKLATACAIKAF